MGRAKDIIVKIIPANVANEFVKKHHYSGKVAPTSTVHFGCFLDDKMHGVLSYGFPIDKNNVIKYVEKTEWNGFIELNRMAFDDYLPKYSESRCISISIKLIKKNAPHIKWILSFSDGTQCGDGTIYRASGFYLIGITKNSTIYEMPDGFKFADIGLRSTSHLLKKRVGYNIGEKFSEFVKRSGAKKLNGFQLRYIYLIDKTCKLTVPILPFSKIDEMGAGMYKGKKVSLQERKHAALAHKGEQESFQTSGAFDSTMPLK
jgi:hypothetical protein